MEESIRTHSVTLSACVSKQCSIVIVAPSVCAVTSDTRLSLTLSPSPFRSLSLSLLSLSRTGADARTRTLSVGMAQALADKVRSMLKNPGVVDKLFERVELTPFPEAELRQELGDLVPEWDE